MPQYGLISTGDLSLVLPICVVYVQRTQRSSCLQALFSYNLVVEVYAQEVYAVRRESYDGYGPMSRVSVMASITCNVYEDLVNDCLSVGIVSPGSLPNKHD